METTATAAPTPVATTIVPPPVVGATTATEGPSDIARAVSAYFGSESAEAVAPPVQAEPTTSVVPPVVAPAAAGPPPVVAAPAPTPKPEDDIDARLAQLDRESRKAALARKERAKQGEESRRSAAQAEKDKAEHAADIELAKRVRESRTSGKKLDLLLAAGYTMEELQGGFFVDALNELDKTEKPATVTRSEAEAIALDKAKAMLKERDDAAKAETEKAKAEAAERALADAEEVIGEATVYYKAGNYPMLKNQKPSKGDLVKFKAVFEGANPGRVLRGKDLLDEAEKVLRQRHDAVREEIARMDKLLSPAAVAPAAATQATPAASSSSISQLAPPPPAKPDETYDEAMERMKREFSAKWS